jgi:hypothetical protein
MLGCGAKERKKEDGGSKVILNTGIILHCYTVSQSRSNDLNLHCCGILESCITSCVHHSCTVCFTVVFPELWSVNEYQYLSILELKLGL